MAFRKAAGWNSLRNEVFLPYDTSQRAEIVVGGGEEPPEPPPDLPFNFELVNELGSTTITSVPNLRISIDSGATWNALGAVPGHTLTLSRHPDGTKLVISGWTGGVVPAGLQVHLKQSIPGEPNPGTGVAGVITELFARKVGGPSPQNPAMPGGMAISPTYYLSPVGVS